MEAREKPQRSIARAPALLVAAAGQRDAVYVKIDIEVGQVQVQAIAAAELCWVAAREAAAAADTAAAASSSSKQASKQQAAAASSIIRKWHAQHELQAL
jgi:hypothetical protein